MALSLVWRRIPPNVAVAEIRGFLTTGTDLQDLEQNLVQFLANQNARLVLDLAHLEMVDSAGVTTLALCAQASDRHGSQVAIANPSPRARKVFEITHLGQILPIFDDLSSAAGSLL